jgi:hypothetical protein
MLWNNTQISNLWVKWNKNSCSELLLVDQQSLDNNIIIEFAVNIKSLQYTAFLKIINEVVIKKIPNGTISFISYLTQNSKQKGYYINTQYKRYRIEFIDSSLKYSENDIKDKSLLFYNKLMEKL